MVETALNANNLIPFKLAHNTGLAKVAVQCFYDTFMVNQSLVLRKNPPLRMVKIATFAKPENVINFRTEKWRLKLIGLGDHCGVITASS